MQSRLQNDSALQTYCSSPGCSPHGTHTARTRVHTLIYICTHTYTRRLAHSREEGRPPSVTSLLGKCFVFMPQTRSLGRRQSSKVHGLKSHQGVAGCCMEEALSAGITAWGGRGGEGGFAGVGRQPGELGWGARSGVRAGREADAGAEIRKCVRVNRCRGFYV